MPIGSGRHDTVLLYGSMMGATRQSLVSALTLAVAIPADGNAVVLRWRRFSGPDAMSCRNP